MKATNDWYEGIEKEIISLKDRMSKSDYKLYELDLLLRVAKRVVGLSSDCEYCQGHRNDISNLVTDLGNSSKMTKEEVADYGRTFKSVLRHLDKRHGLHRSVLNPAIPLGIGGLIFLIMLFIGQYIPEYSGFIVVVYIGLFASIIPMGVGIGLGITRLLENTFKSRIWNL